jgi:hypothetical protein
MTSDIAHTVSSIGVWGSGRWQKARSTKSRPRRASDPSMAWRRYFRLSVCFVLTLSVMPMKNLVEITKVSRAQPSSAMAWPMIRSDPPCA